MRTTGLSLMSEMFHKVWKQGNCLTRVAFAYTKGPSFAPIRNTNPIKKSGNTSRRKQSIIRKMELFHGCKKYDWSYALICRAGLSLLVLKSSIRMYLSFT